MRAESAKVPDLSGAVVTVVEPGLPAGRARLLRRDGQWALENTPEYERQPPSSADPELHISPGWVDLHAHVYDGMTEISVHPDRVGLDQGVHLLADAGSAGAATISGLAKYVLPRARTEVLAWINIGSHGLVHLREVADPTFINVDATIAAVEAHRNLIRGVKVRSSGAIVGPMGLQPLQLAKIVARATGTPLMVHIGEAPPVIEDVLDLLDEGDVVTHCFHGKVGKPWDRTGQPIAALSRALARGVILDVGHGAASFDIKVACTAGALGIWPTTISTDVHVRNIDGPVFSLAAVMTKMLHCGMPLNHVIAATTTAPREVLGSPQRWVEPDGRIRHATLFRLTDNPPTGRQYVDSSGIVLAPARHLVAAATISPNGLQACETRNSTATETSTSP